MTRVNQNTAATSGPDLIERDSRAPDAPNGGGTARRDRPILFSAPMVLALLDGRKAMTRRILRLPKWASSDPGDIEFGDSGAPEVICRDTGCLAALPLPFAIGDRLWVKETWRSTGDDGRADYLAPSKLQAYTLWFEADGAPPASRLAGKLRPSLFMPRWASRLTLLVTDVRVERLHDISESDAEAEGIEHWPAGSSVIGNPYGVGLGEGKGWCSGGTAKEAFQALWQVINGPEAWATNPWVVAVSFAVVARNIDDMPAPLAPASELDIAAMEA